MTIKFTRLFVGAERLFNSPAGNPVWLVTLDYPGRGIAPDRIQTKTDAAINLWIRNFRYLEEVEVEVDSYGKVVNIKGRDEGRIASYPFHR